MTHDASAAANERLAALLEAVVAVTSDLELSVVLHRITEAACALVDATYGALGVLGPSGEEVVEFITHGVTEEQRAAIGPPPHGRGLLGVIIRSPHALRVDRIADHPDSYGFPPHHPAMTSFLGAPVRIRDEVFGNLYLTDKRGADGFTEQDEEILTALAAAAGVAIDNARLFHRTLAQRRWGELMRDVVSDLLQGASEQDALAAAAAGVHELSGARGCLVARSRGADLVVEATAGETGRRCGEPVTDPLWREALAATSSEPRQEGDETLVPLVVPGQTALGLFALLGAPEGADDLQPLAEFGQRLAVGLAAASLQRERARVELLEDRDRIARDMHDHVIQRLFATGLSLQSAARLAREPAVRDRIDTAVDEVDAVIKDIRHTIFALHREPGPRSLTGELSAICDAAIVSLGFAPTLSVQGSTAVIPDTMAADLLAVVREGLSNTARHARASTATVTVVVDRGVTVRVEDDGRGVAEGVSRSGLDNLARRATSRGGGFELGPAPGGTGTVIIWTVPLPEGAAGTFDPAR